MCGSNIRYENASRSPSSGFRRPGAVPRPLVLRQAKREVPPLPPTVRSPTPPEWKIWGAACLQEWLRCNRNTFSCRHSWRRRSSSSWRASNWSGRKNEVTKHEMPSTTIWESDIHNLYWNLSVKFKYMSQLVIACCHKLRWNHQSIGLNGTFRISSLWFLLG